MCVCLCSVVSLTLGSTNFLVEPRVAPRVGPGEEEGVGPGAEAGVEPGTKAGVEPAEEAGEKTQVEPQSEELEARR